MTTKKEFEAQLRYMQNPPKMSMDDALSAERPEFEIGIRIAAKEEELTAVENTFWEVESFLGDALNGGIMQALCNDTGSYIESVHNFTTKYCGVDVSDIFNELKALFPSCIIPIDRDERNEIIEQMSDDFEIDPFDELTQRFYQFEDRYIEGLIAFAKEHRGEITCLE